MLHAALEWYRQGGARIRIALAVIVVLGAATAAWAVVPNLAPFPDPSGTVSTFSTDGSIDTGSPFFQSLGTNGRSCGTCHTPGSAFGLSAAEATARFASSGGADPLFAAVDGGNCPTAAPGVLADHSLLASRGLIRVSLPVPASAQFSIQAVYDPYGCALTVDPQTGQTDVSVYRRPLPATSLRFLSAVMWDGRETVAPLNDPSTFMANLVTDLTHQATDATLGHAQATTPPTAAQLSAIVDFELSLSSAQALDEAAGRLDTQGATGGASALSRQPFAPGTNDSLGTGFTPDVFTLFTSWATIPAADGFTGAREAVARGEAIFNRHPLTITAVTGLNDALGRPAIAGTCTTCHDMPNVGNHSLPLPLDVGTSHALLYESDPQIAAALSQFSAPGLPVYHLVCGAGPLQGRQFYTSDPGRALLTGQCADIGRIKGPVLRGLAARAPYFHNGAAVTLDQVVDFYDQRFQIGLTDHEKSDLVAFLRSL